MAMALGKNGKLNVSKRTAAATAARVEAGSETDATILEKIRENPGLSTYQLAKILGSTIGKIDGSIDRLLTRGEVEERPVLRGGRLMKQVYPKGFVRKQERSVKLDGEFPQFGDKKNKVFIYALDRVTLGISASKLEDWKDKSLVNEEVELEKRRDETVVKIPSKLADFYLWENSSSDLTAVGDRILLTVRTELPIEKTAFQERTGPKQFNDFRNLIGDVDLQLMLAHLSDYASGTTPVSLSFLNFTLQERQKQTSHGSQTLQILARS